MRNLIQIKLVILLTFLVTNVNAKVWRINNNDNTADFNDIKVAHDNVQVSAGDTLLVEGSQTYYTSFTCTKKLTIIGPGYYLSTNYRSADVLNARIDELVFDSGSEGSTVIGITFSSSTLYSGPYIRVDKINIERCYIEGQIQLQDVENIRIVGCYLKTLDDYSSLYTLFNSIYLDNNIISGNISLNSNCHILSCKNNIFLGTSYTFNAYHFRNNIVISDEASMSINSSYVENNIGTNNVFGEGNLNVSDINALFLGGDSPDAKYELATGSEAIGAGYEGIDCGIFGGDDPYVISGLPPLPIVTELDVDDAVSTETGLKVKIKVRSN